MNSSWAPVGPRRRNSLMIKLPAVGAVGTNGPVLIPPLDLFPSLPLSPPSLSVLSSPRLTGEAATLITETSADTSESLRDTGENVGGTTTIGTFRALCLRFEVFFLA